MTALPEQITVLGVETVDPATLTPHPENANRGDVDAIAESLAATGQYRPVVVNQDGTILAGHHVVQAAIRLGWPEVRIERIQATEQQGRRILLADNRIAELGPGIDPEALAVALQNLDDLTGTGYTENDLTSLLDALGNTEPPAPHGPDYTSKVKIPHYAPQGDTPPPLAELYDRTRTVELETEILAAGLPDDVTEFLIAAAQRHTVINFRKVADYYAHAPAELQKLMEAQALVIIDVDQAIARGYVRLSEQMYELLDADKAIPSPRAKAEQ